MNKKIFTYLFAGIVLFFSQNTLFAQQPIKKTPRPVAVSRVKQPIVKSYLATFTGVKSFCSAAQGKQVIAFPLVIKDDKGFVYKLSSYQFAYKRKGVTEDEETGKTAPVSTLVAQHFSETPLPEIWKANIIEQLQNEEELYFFDIIAVDKKGRLFFAPDLKILIQ